MDNDVSSLDRLIAVTSEEIGELQDWISRSQGEPLVVYMAVSVRLSERREFLVTVQELRSSILSD